MQLFFAGIASAALLMASVAASDAMHLFGAGSQGDNSGAPAALTLDWQHEVTPGKCAPAPLRRGDDRRGTGPVINIVEQVKNDADSGVAGNYWAFDNLSRRIQVWRTATTTFCATVTYEGSFKAIAGQTAPAGTSTLSGAEKGQIQGGYRATITGTLLATSTWPTRGSVGSVDYACDPSGNCPGYIDWTTKYFASGVNQNLDWWGWIYRGGKFGTWINAITGNEGNIVSPAASPNPWGGGKDN